ncbi:hypothetical protein ESA94_05100 [Lacibacter luteus]|uniref:Uncharacterized protein n=1 Tax=Lacibacter luteus TaxID=2508719 RepID=A0A4Q1CMT0_9BACT|nr:hypothetical protein [Lacibacter luteus]RXK62388.1 hypothetical protein ESA94_05100 [Lacibacter luteus]
MNKNAFIITNAVLAISALILWLKDEKAVSVFLISILLLFFIFWILVRVVFRVKYTYGISDIFIGDEGGFSLSRLQAVVWAFIIIAYQLSVAIALGVNQMPNAMYYYELTFSEETLFLLGLSLGSYISVKGITVDKINKHPELIKHRKPKFSDIIIGDNGIDFSRVQMLIWTVIALFVFSTKVVYFINEIIGVTDPSQFKVLFNSNVDQFLEFKKDGNETTKGHLPYLPWSFLVLMGLSQGAYIGKKLIPTFKLDDLKLNKEEELRITISSLNTKKALLSNILTKTAANNISEIDRKNIANLENEIAAAQKKVEELNKEMQLIQEYKK